MKNSLKGLLAVGLLMCALVAQAAPTPFKTTYDELLDEFPNIHAELKEVTPLTEGNKRRGGSIKIGTGLLLLEAEGKSMDKLELFSCGMIITSQTSTSDTDTIDELCYSFVRKLARTEKTYWQARAYMAEELKRQLNVIKAGGVPKAIHKVSGQTRQSVSVNAGNGLMSVSYSFNRLD